jgi:formylglycine-generating enzyme required for sulfatase activity
MRGGSFYYFSKVARSSYRTKNLQQVNSYWLGFRVVRELP